QAFNYPLSFKSKAGGLVVNYTIPPTATSNDYRQPISAVDGVTIGVSGLSATSMNVFDHSDWGVTLDWNNSFFASINIGSPFTYFEKNTGNSATINVGFNPGASYIQGNKVIIENNVGGAAYIVFGPQGSTWTGSGGTYTSTLNGKNYWSMVMVPPGESISNAIAQLEQYAFVFPGNTQVSWSYNESNSKVTSTFTVTPNIKEGPYNVVLQGLLPHQWDHLSGSSPQPSGYIYESVRGELKMLSSNSFTVEHTFHGILPTMPELGKYTDGYNPADLATKIDEIQNDQLPGYTDSYNEGQGMNRLIQAARIADQMGNTEARDLLVNTVKTRLEDWLSAENGEEDFIFYYHDTWTALLGYPSGHGQSTNINDHHFHWGYFIHAAAAIEQFSPGWAAQWGDMI
ncbi:MAG: glycosyl hydrolase, partial [Marinoscillum sp.]